MSFSFSIICVTQVDFETSLAENRFTIKPNVDPAIDESRFNKIKQSDSI